MSSQQVLGKNFKKTEKCFPKQNESIVRRFQKRYNFQLKKESPKKKTPEKVITN